MAQGKRSHKWIYNMQVSHVTMEQHSPPCRPKMFLMYRVLPILFLKYHYSEALPVYSTPPSNETCHLTETMLALIHSTPHLRQRTLINIVWSCILTVMICAWTSVHPNLPPQSRQQALLKSIKLMFWTIVAPELILAWAVRQWYAAKEVRNIYNEHKGMIHILLLDGSRIDKLGMQASKRWTTEHGHFLIMGGYQLVDKIFKKYEERDRPGWIATIQDWEAYYEYQERRAKSRLGVLTMDRFKELIKDPNFEFPTITAAEIKDRSKGDGLSKTIAIFQTSWFITQCFARYFQGLALTELELVTLAMASLNAITFVFWWGKPLGVQFPVNVYVKAEAVEGKTIQNDEA